MKVGKNDLPNTEIHILPPPSKQFILLEVEYDHDNDDSFGLFTIDIVVDFVGDKLGLGL